MAIVDAWGFHQIATGADLQREAAAFAGTAPTIISDIAGAGAQSVQLPAGSNVWTALPVVEDPGSEWCLHWWWEMASLSVSQSATPSLGLGHVGGNPAGVYLTLGQPGGSGATSNLYVRRGSATITQLSMDGRNGAAPWRLHVVEHGSTGVIELWRGTELLYSTSSENTSRTAAGTYDRLRLGAYGSFGQAARIGHIVLTDGEDLGTTALVGAAPADTDVGPNEWTRSNGGLDHYEHIEQAPHDGDTTYLGSDTAGNRTRHRSTIVVPGRRILSARVSVVAMLEEKGFDRIGVTYESGTADPVTHVLEEFSHVGYHRRAGPLLLEDPDTEEEWTAGGLSAMEYELEHLAPEE